MNKVILMGRLTRDPEIRYSAGDNGTAVAHFSLAVDRRFRRDQDQQTTDFFNCTAFGRQAEFAEKYLRQGIKMLITGRIQLGSYTNRDGQRVNTTDIIVEELEFAESKAASDQYSQRTSSPAPAPSPRAAAPMPAPEAAAGVDGLMNIPDGIDEELPFN